MYIYIQTLKTYAHIYIYIYIYGVGCDVMVTVVGNVHGDSGSNPGRGCLYFTLS